MFPLGPRTTLMLLLALAAVVLGGGLRLARRVETVRVDRDRTALNRFADDVQGELQRLETLYENHLLEFGRERVLTSLGEREDASDIRTAADRIVGVQQVSVFRLTAPEESHIPVYGQRLPVPTMHVPQSGMVGFRQAVLMPTAKLFDADGPDRGWIDEPGKPLFYWMRVQVRTPTVIVLLIDRDAERVAIGNWLKSWGDAIFAPVRVAGGPDLLRPRDGRALLAEGSAETERPDLLLPVHSRFGTWELASWDRREVRVHYDFATVATTGVLVLFIGGLAMLIFAQQTRAAALAAQRVSFVNRVSHELRTPLTNILLNLDLAAEALDEPPADATRRLDLVQEEVRRLGRLIDNVLSFSRREEKKLRVEARACVPAGVIATVVEQFAPSFARRGLEVRCTGALAAPCLLDADALAQILANLLSNVEKYVPGGVVEIEGSLSDGTLTVRVSDQGPGIPEDAAERVFRPFERLDSRVNEGASGTGLGLAIARDLATAMGGSLRLISSARGACFELRVPAPAAPPLTSISAA